jgi:hypothetical protein
VDLSEHIDDQAIDWCPKDKKSMSTLRTMLSQHCVIDLEIRLGEVKEENCSIDDIDSNKKVV